MWDVHNSTLEDGDMNGMWKLTVFCAGIQLVPLALLGLLPRDMKEQVYGQFVGNLKLRYSLT